MQFWSVTIPEEYDFVLIQQGTWDESVHCGHWWNQRLFSRRLRMIAVQMLWNLICFTCKIILGCNINVNLFTHGTSNRRVLEQKGKPEYLSEQRRENRENLSEQGRDLPTNLTHTWRQGQDSNPGHNGGRGVLSPLCHHCSPCGLSATANSLQLEKASWPERK